MLKKIILAVVMCFVVSIPVITHTMSPRDAVILESWHALSPLNDGQSNQADPNCQWLVGEWNYLYNDLNAFSTVRGWYGGDASVHSEFTNTWHYGLYWPFGQYDCRWYKNGWLPDDNVGRGGQCKFFANLVVYRSGAYQRRLPAYPDMWSRATHIGWVRPGDVILTYNNGARNHVAIVVGILSGNPNNGTVSAVDVVDSNYVGWGQYICMEEGKSTDPEVISRHIIAGDILQKYRVFNIY